MSTLQIITNNHERQFKYDYEVPASVLSDYDWLDDDAKCDGWIHYRTVWSHISDYMLLSDGHPFGADWSASTSDSAFSGTLLSVSDDGEGYKIALYLS